MARSEVYRSARATISKLLERKVEAAAEAYADTLRENVGKTSGGQGTHWPGLPHRSSAPSQYPIFQSGELHESVDARRTDNPLLWQAGFFDEDEAKLRSLEYGSIHMAERAPLQRSADDMETRRKMLEAAKKAV